MNAYQKTAEMLAQPGIQQPVREALLHNVLADAGLTDSVHGSTVGDDSISIRFSRNGLPPISVPLKGDTSMYFLHFLCRELNLRATIGGQPQ
jgi:hypothetical protein